MRGVAYIAVDGEVTAPFLQLGLQIAAFGMDRSALRNHAGALIASGDAVQGILSHVSEWCFIDAGEESVDRVEFDVGDGIWRQISADRRRRLFGWTSESGDGRADLVIDDLIIFKDSDKKTSIKEIGFRNISSSIDQSTGATKETSLVVAERHFEDGRAVHFSGTARCICTEAEADDLINFLNFLSAHVDALGVNRSVGWGKFVNLYFKRERFEGLGAGRLISAQTNKRQKLSIETKLPLMIAPTSLSDNIQESSDFFPGQVLFGALADQLDLIRGDDGHVSDFDDGTLGHLVFRHAYPSMEGLRETPVGMDEIRWKSMSGGSLQLHRDDWKNSPHSDEQIASIDGLREAVLPERMLRTRTAIRKNSNAPEPERLFTQSLLVPTDRIAWIGELELISDDPIHVQSFAMLCAWINKYGFVRIGKTSANVRVSLSNLDARLNIPAGKIEIILNSDCVMIGESVSGDLTKAYCTYFRNISDGISLREFRSLETWTVDPVTRSKHLRRLMTRAGSVFCLELNEAGAVALNRLPFGHLPNATTDSTFRNTAFVPENGYGEFRWQQS